MMPTGGFLIFELVLVGTLFLRVSFADKSCPQSPEPVGLTVFAGVPVVLIVTWRQGFAVSVFNVSIPIDILVEEDEGFPGGRDTRVQGLSSKFLEICLS